MLQLKRALGNHVVGIMVYVHVPGFRLGLEAAKAYCYPFDHFVGLDLRRPEQLELVQWCRVADIIEETIVKAGTVAG